MLGQTIAHYRILEKLGSGGMGVVYKAQDTNLGRTVALKFLATHLLESEEHKQRFLREAKATASLDHPNICMVHEVGEADGQVFLAMGYIDGPEVRTKIKERPLKLEEALDIVIQAAEGLRAAHQNGVVHRDIKSSNLMLTSTGQVKIMDFGLAQLSGGSRLTKTDTILGTPAYMSPEQASGQTTDRRTDIWSSGVVLYEMVTGRLPFEGEREQAVVYSIINEPHEPVTAIRAGVPLELDRIVSKALAKKPEERYQHLDDMLVDLRALREKPLTGSQSIAAVAPARRHALIAGAGVIAASLALALGLNLGGIRDRMTSGGSTVPAIASIAVLPLQNFSGDPEQEYFSDGLTEGLITELAKVGALKVISRTSVMRYKGTDKPLPQIARELGVDAVLEGSAQRVGDNVRITAQLINAATDEHLWAETYDRGMADLLRVQSEVTRAIAQRINIALTPEQETRLAGTRAISPAVYEAYLKGMFHLSKRTPAGIQQGMAYFQEAVEKDPANPLAYAGLALGYITLAHGPDPPEYALRQAKGAAQTALKLDDSLPEALAAMAFLRGYYDWQWDEADEILRRALEVNPSLAIAHYHSSWFHVLFGRNDEAIAAHKRAQEMDPLMPMHTSDLGVLYVWLGRYDEAIEEGRKSIEINPNFPNGYVALGLAYRDLERYDEAIDAHRKMAELSPLFRWELGSTYAAAGRIDEAREVLAELKQQKVTPWNAFFLAKLHTALGEKDEAFRWLNYEHPHAWVPWVRVWPDFQSLRGDPRFDDLLRKMNLPL